jgi:hypothetical protein
MVPAAAPVDVAQQLYKDEEMPRPSSLAASSASGKARAVVTQQPAVPVLISMERQPESVVARLPSGEPALHVQRHASIQGRV